MASILRTWWADSRGKVIVVLLSLWLAALLYHFRIEFVWHIAVAVVSAILFDVILGILTYGKGRISLSSVVTGLLIGLVFDPTSGALPVASAALLAIASKHYLRNEIGKHVFNPAAFGIVSSSFFFARPVAWWGASWGIVPVILLTIGMVPVLYKLRRLWMSVTFLLIYFFSNFSVSGLEGALRLTFDGTVFLFALVMLPEPITSVGRGMWRYVWGILIGAIILAENTTGFAFTDPLLFALLLANILGFFLARNKPLIP